MQQARLATVSLCVVFAAVALSFALAFADHGYVPTDQGFVLGQAWRVHGGQVPYRDFFYIRSPGSLYLHAMWFALPDPWVVRAARFGYYGQLAIAGLVPALVVLRAGLAASTVRLACLGAAFYAIALHNFPPMPWYTVDGVFFASLGLAALLASARAGATGRSLAWRAIAASFGALAALVKQNYLALPVALALADAVALGVAVARRAPADRLRASALRVAASALPPVALLGLAAAGLAAAGAWGPFVEQVGGAGSLPALLRVGVQPWTHGSVLAALAVGAALVATARRAAAPRLAALALAVAPLLVAAGAWDLESWSATENRAGQWIFAAIAGGVFASAVRASRGAPVDASARLGLLLQVGVLAIAWSASISFGAATPLLGLAAGGAAVETLLPAPTRGRAVHAALWVTCAFVVVARVFSLNLEEPYRTVPRARQTSALHEVFPRFGRLFAGSRVGERTRDLKHQLDVHALGAGRDFTVVPGFPLVHFLVDRQTRAPMDWYVRFDLGALLPDVVRRLEAFDGVILLERRPSELPCTAEEFSAPYRRLNRLVFERSRLIASSEYFCIVEPRGAASPEP